MYSALEDDHLYELKTRLLRDEKDQQEYGEVILEEFLIDENQDDDVIRVRVFHKEEDDICFNFIIKPRYILVPIQYISIKERKQLIADTWAPIESKFMKYKLIMYIIMIFILSTITMYTVLQYKSIITQWLFTILSSSMVVLGASLLLIISNNMPSQFKDFVKQIIKDKFSEFNKNIGDRNNQVGLRIIIMKIVGSSMRREVNSSGKGFFKQVKVLSVKASYQIQCSTETIKEDRVYQFTLFAITVGLATIHAIMLFVSFNFEEIK